jgi:hypothetical protein
MLKRIQLSLGVKFVYICLVLLSLAAEAEKFTLPANAQILPALKKLSIDKNLRNSDGFQIHLERYYGMPRECGSTLSPGDELKPLCFRDQYFSREVTIPKCEKGFAAVAHKAIIMEARKENSTIFCRANSCDELLEQKDSIENRPYIAVVTWNSYIRNGRKADALVLNGGEMKPGDKSFQISNSTKCISLTKGFRQTMQAITPYWKLEFHDDIEPKCPHSFRLKDGYCIGRTSAESGSDSSAGKNADPSGRR